MAALLADHTSAVSGLDIMTQTMQFPRVIPVEAVEDALEVSFLMAARDGVFVEIPPNRISTDIRQL